MSAPQQMRSVVVEIPGGPDVLKVRNSPVPTPSADQVLIKVAFAGVNRHDVRVRAKGPTGGAIEEALGLEVSGKIVAVGSEVPAKRVGERVCALLHDGGYAEYSVADSSVALPLPDGMTLPQGACLPEALFTAWNSLFEMGGLKSGEWLLLQGGTSGVGVMALQLACALGVHVIAMAGSVDKATICRELGAEYVINYRNDDMEAVVCAATGGRGVDVVLDMVGGLYAERNLRSLAMDGKLVHLSVAQSPQFNVPLGLILARRACVTGSYLRALPPARKALIAGKLLQTVWPLLGVKIHPIISATHSLTMAADAHREMERGDHIGKLLLAVDEF